MASSQKKVKDIETDEEFDFDNSDGDEQFEVNEVLSSDADFTLSASMKPGMNEKSGGKSAKAQPEKIESEARKRLAAFEAEQERERQEKRRK